MKLWSLITKVRRQRELLSRLEDEMVLVREQREEVRSSKFRFFNFFRWQGSWMRSRGELWRPRWGFKCCSALGKRWKMRNMKVLWHLCKTSSKYEFNQTSKGPFETLIPFVCGCESKFSAKHMSLHIQKAEGHQKNTHAKTYLGPKCSGVQCKGERHYRSGIVSHILALFGKYLISQYQGYLVRFYIIFLVYLQGGFQLCTIAQSLQKISVRGPVVVVWKDPIFVKFVSRLVCGFQFYSMCIGKYCPWDRIRKYCPGSVLGKIAQGNV